ncbi:MAG: hypothetical protein Q9163_001270 [Psora crenata]
MRRRRARLRQRFYVNVYTKKSQWEKPTEPVYPPSDADVGAPHGPPPGYTAGESSYPAEKEGHLSTNNPYSSAHSGSSSQNLTEDERFARQLQAEEDARARIAGVPRPNTGERGEADAFYGQQQGQAPGYPPQQQAQPSSYDQQQLPPRDAKKSSGLSGLLGRLGGRHSGSHHAPQGYPSQGYGGYPPQQQYGGYPQHVVSGPGGAFAMTPRRHAGGGMGAAGGAALGLGGGLLGGALLAGAMDGGDGGGDYGGGDDGGGDYGDGGGDGGGGDFGGGD